MAKKSYLPQLYDQVLETVGIYAFSQPKEYLAYFCRVGERVLHMRGRRATKLHDKDESEFWHNLARQVDLLARTIEKNL